MAIQSIGTNSILNNLNISNTTEQKTNGTSFSNVLSDAISKVNDSEVNANNKIESLNLLINETDMWKKGLLQQMFV